MKPEKLQALAKVLIHEHLDCSLRPGSMLELWQEEAAEFGRLPANFPPELKADHGLRSAEQRSAHYASFLASEASRSLANYVSAIGEHILPLMQSKERLERITRERIEDARADGVVALELRFAPQLHRQGGLELADVMDAVISGLDAAGIPVSLTICCLRHENARMAQELLELALAYKSRVGTFDLAGDEAANPGVLSWYGQAALKAREAGLDCTIHLWETNEPADEDLVRLQEFGLQRLGHGMRGERQQERILEVCPSSNLITGQVPEISQHPIDKLYRRGCRVTVNTDGTLFTGSSLTNEYELLTRHFGWGMSEFAAVNRTALEAASFSRTEKAQLAEVLERAYSLP